MAKKVSKKSTTVDYLVDLTNAQTAEDVYLSFALAKVDGNFTQNEVNALTDTITPKIYIVYENECKCDCCEKPVKKPNIFKRFWNWVTGK